MKRSIALLIAGFIALPAFAAKPQIQWNPNYDHSSIKTFQWQAPKGPSLESSDPFLHRAIVAAIESELSASGLTEVQSNPDVYVTYHASSQTEVRLDSDSYGYGFGGYGRGGWGYYGYGMAGPISTTTRVTEYERGTLVVDIWDASQNELVWRGSVSGIVVSDKPEKTQKEAVKAIQKMAKQSRKLRAKGG